MAICRGCEFADRVGCTWDAVRHDPWCNIVPSKLTLRDRFLVLLLDLTSSLGLGRIYQWLGRRL